MNSLHFTDKFFLFQEVIQSIHQNDTGHDRLSMLLKDSVVISKYFGLPRLAPAPPTNAVNFDGYIFRALQFKEGDKVWNHR